MGCRVFMYLKIKYVIPTHYSVILRGGNSRSAEEFIKIITTAKPKNGDAGVGFQADTYYCQVSDL